MNNIYYCPDNIIINEFTPQKYEKELNFVLDYFLLDLQNKKVLLYDQTIKDSFVESIGEIKKINIVNQGEEKQIEITPVEGEPIIITVNKLNQMIKLVNNNVRVIGDNFLWRNKGLQKVVLTGVEEIGSSFLMRNEIIEEVILTKVKRIGNFCFCENKKLQKLELLEVERVGLSPLWEHLEHSIYNDINFEGENGKTSHR